ncbi:hypothetical protein BN844_2151 [Pseudomonas sp. SHC52]|nr:hypothetical protein BN844_2151 [Pseudomonas sp. SHC52]
MGHGGWRVRLGGDGLGLFGQPQRRRMLGQALEQRRRAGADQQRGTAVHQHVDQAAGGLLDVQRQVRRAGLEGGEQGNDEIGAAFHGQGDHAVVADALGAQVLAEAVGLSIEFTVGQCHLAIAYRQLFGVCDHLLFETLVQAVLRHRQLRAEPLYQQLLAFFRAQPLQFVDPALPLRRHRQQNRAQLCGQHRDLGVAEAAAVVADQVVQLFVRHHDQRQREVVATLGQGDAVGPLLAGRGAEAQAAGVLVQCIGDREVFEHQDRIEQRLFSGDARHRLEFAQGQVGVVAQVAVGVLQLLQPIHQRRAVGPLYPQRQGVDEQPDGAVDRRQVLRAAGDGDAVNHVVTPGMLAQQQRPGALDQGVDGQVVATGEL